MTNALISVPELHSKLGEVSLFDIRWQMDDAHAGHRRYLDGHIPTAVFVDLDKDLSAETGPGRHPLPDAATFATTLSRLGVGPHSDVVVYDDAGGSIAARMWWMLTAIGHRGAVRVLDGGWAAWSDSGYPADNEDVVPGAAAYPVPARGFQGVVDAETVEAMSGTLLLLDARAPERYRGEVEPIDPKAGHIPGALSAPWTDNLTPDGHMQDPASLRRHYEALGAGRRPVVTSCGSGVTACHLALALHIGGLPRPSVYIGSFSDWSTAGKPVVEGPNPR